MTTKKKKPPMPYGWSEREVLNVLRVVIKVLRKSRGVTYTMPRMQDVSWHLHAMPTLRKTIDGVALYLAHGQRKALHAIGFADGLVMPGTVKEREREEFYKLFGESCFAVVPPRAKKPKPSKLVKAQADVHRWTAEIVRRQRALAAAQKKLASARRSERALIRAAEERAARPPERMDEGTLRARVRALRKSSAA